MTRYLSKIVLCHIDQILLQDFLEKILKRCFVKCVEWPPSSPDVNPLDSLDPVDPLLLGFCKNEGILMQSWTAIQFRRRIKNKNKSCVERLYNRFETLRKAIKQFVPRLQAVEEKQGYCIKMIFG